MQLSGFDLFVWAAAFLGHVVLLLVLWIRHRAGDFPVFTTLIVTSVARTITLYFILHYLTTRAYFYSYWLMAVVDAVLQLLVFYELSSHVFCPVGVWARDVRRTFIGIVCASILVAAFLTWLASPATRTPVQAVVIRGNFFSSVLMSELFVGMLALSATAGLPWKTHVARIAQGLGAYSIVCVFTQAASSYFGVSHDTHTYTLLSHIQIFTYLICTGYWIVTLWQEAPAPRELPEEMRMQIYTLQRQVEHDLVRVRPWRRY
jgi:hypothetical protein